MQRSSGTLRSRQICPSSPLTDRKIDEYARKGFYGPKIQTLAKAKLQPRRSTPLKSQRLPSTSLALYLKDYL